MRQSVRVATGAAIVATFTAASAAHADSYVNSQQLLPHQYGNFHSGAYAQGVAPTPVPRVAPRPVYRVRPAAQPQTGTNFGVFLRDTRGEGYGPNGR